MSHKKHLTIDEALDQIHSESHLLPGAVPVTPDTKLSILWVKVRPFVSMLAAIFGKKIGVYINAFIAAIDTVVADEEE